MSTRTVMLASASTSRRRLCGLAMPEGFQLLDEKLKPDIDEKSIRHEDPRKMVVAIAHAKAVKALQMLTDAGMEEESPGFVICCDQVIVFDGEVREKPESAEQAKEHLQSYGLAEKPAECVCGVVVVNVKTGKTVEGVNEAQQFFKEIPDDVANALIQKGEVMYCSGSFVVEDKLLEPYVGETVGEIESVQGMPIALTRKLLLEADQGLA